MPTTTPTASTTAHRPLANRVLAAALLTAGFAFDSASQQPVQIVRIRYDSYVNLVAKGVIRESRPQPERRPNAFPADPQPSYVPDPPRY